MRNLRWSYNINRNSMLIRNWCGVGFEEYLKRVKGPFLGCFLSFVQVPMDFFKELGRHAKRSGSQECPNIGACMESVEHVLFECAS